MDHLKQDSLKIEDIEYFILDEADEMLNMGFIEDIKNIFSKANPEGNDFPNNILNLWLTLVVMWVSFKHNLLSRNYFFNIVRSR